MLQRWWEVWLGRLDYELEALQQAGISAQVNKDLIEGGIVRIDFQYTAPDGNLHRMFAVFPELYPYFRFEIYAPSLDLPHHQNPIGKNLCLIGRATGNWDPKETLAGFITDRLADVIRAGSSDTIDEVADIEEHQAEPVSAFYDYARGPILLVDSAWVVDPVIREGDLLIGLDQDVDEFDGVVRGAVLEIRDSQRNVLATAHDSWLQRYRQTFRANWLAPIAAPRTKGGDATFAALRKEFPRRAEFMPKRVGRYAIGVIGMLVPEETAWRKPGTGWVFLAAVGDRWHKNTRPMLVRAGQAGPSDLRSRIPDLSGLESSRLCVVGLGGLGATAALEFARSGVGTLVVIDHDIVEPGTVVRWPFGMTSAGQQKTAEIAGSIRRNYPYTKVTAFDIRIGGQPEIGVSQLEGLRQAFEVDAIYDATAELGLQYFLSDLARVERLRYIAVSTTLGAWGGIVLRLSPELNAACWICFRLHQEDGTVPYPPHDPNGTIQPIGCASPTYTGTSFDVGLIALSGVKFAISTLTAVDNAGSHVIVIALRDANGPLIVPQSSAMPLERHPRCSGRHA